MVRTPRADVLATALAEDGLTFASLGDNGFRVDADATAVGETALRAGVALTQLGAADGAGLEEMFLELTAGTAREGAAA